MKIGNDKVPLAALSKDIESASYGSLTCLGISHTPLGKKKKSTPRPWEPVCSRFVRSSTYVICFMAWVSRKDENLRGVCNSTWMMEQFSKLLDVPRYTLIKSKDDLDSYLIEYINNCFHTIKKIYIPASNLFHTIYHNPHASCLMPSSLMLLTPGYRKIRYFTRIDYLFYRAIC
jgi:hypothetical protein